GGAGGWAEGARTRGLGEHGGGVLYGGPQRVGGGCCFFLRLAQGGGGPPRRYRRCHLEAVGVQRQCSAQRATEYRILDLPAGGGPYVRERAAAARWNIRGVCLVAQGRPVAIAPRVVLADEHEVVP